jgi:hypothetical protein
MHQKTKGTLWTIGVAAVAAVASTQALGLFGGGSPSMFAPCPLPFVMLAWGPLTPYGVPVVVAISVILWCLPLLRGIGYVPVRTVVLAWLVGLTSVAWFVSAAVQRSNTDEPVYTSVVIGASVLLGSATMLSLRRARRKPGIPASAFAHGFLFVWFVSYAYPWFGEVP